MSSAASPRKRPLDIGDENADDRSLAVREPPRQKRRTNGNGPSRSVLGLLKQLVLGSLRAMASPTSSDSPPQHARSGAHDAYAGAAPKRAVPEMREVSRMEAYVASASKSGRIAISKAPRTPLSIGASIERPPSAPASSMRSLPSASKTPQSAPPTASTSRLPLAPSTSRLPPAPSSSSSLRRRGSEGSLRDALQASSAMSARKQRVEQQRARTHQLTVDQCASQYGSAASRPARTDVDLVGTAQLLAVPLTRQARKRFKTDSMLWRRARGQLVRLASSRRC